MIPIYFGRTKPRIAAISKGRNRIGEDAIIRVEQAPKDPAPALDRQLREGGAFDDDAGETPGRERASVDIDPVRPHIRHAYRRAPVDNKPFERLFVGDGTERSAWSPQTLRRINEPARATIRPASCSRGTGKARLGQASARHAATSLSRRRVGCRGKRCRPRWIGVAAVEKTSATAPAAPMEHPRVRGRQKPTFGDF